LCRAPGSGPVNHPDKKGHRLASVARASSRRWDQLQQRSRQMNPIWIRITACKKPILLFRPRATDTFSRTPHGLAAPKFTTSGLLVNPIIGPSAEFLKPTPPVLNRSPWHTTLDRVSYEGTHGRDPILTVAAAARIKPSMDRTVALGHPARYRDLAGRGISARQGAAIDDRVSGGHSADHHDSGTRTELLGRAFRQTTTGSWESRLPGPFFRDHAS